MTQDFSRNYSPPGVYIEEDASTLVAQVGIPPTLACVVGPARGYQVYTEQFPLAEDGLTLAKQGIDLSSVVVTRADSGTEVASSDYTATKIGSASDQTYYSQFASVSEPATPLGTVVFVTYRYTDPTYYDPKRLTNFEDVKALYGEPLNLAVQTPGDTNYQYVTSPLSLAAMIAIQNGATDLVCVATTPPPGSASTDAAKSTARKAALVAAYAKVDSDPNINVIVPVTTGILAADAQGVLSDFRSALNSADLAGYHRFGIIGFDPGVDSAPDTVLSGSAAKSRLFMYAYATPSGMQMYSGGANSSFAVGHQYLAAAYAGRFSALPIQRGLTKQVIAGFSGLAGTPLANSLKSQYAAAGIAVTEVDRFGRLTVLHGVTTDTTNVNTREASVVRARGALITALAEAAATSGLVGAPLDDDLLLSVKSVLSGVLESAISDEVILSYTNLAVRQTSNEPSVVEVKFAYKPAYPLNYILISFSIDTSTGLTDLNTDETLV